MSEVFLLLGVLIMVRAQVVFNRHGRRIDEIHARNTKAINDGTFQEQWFGEYERVGNFYLDLLDLTKWTYRQFYPTELPSTEAL